MDETIITAIATLGLGTVLVLLFVRWGHKYFEEVRQELAECRQSRIDMIEKYTATIREQNGKHAKAITALKVQVAELKAVIKSLKAKLSK